MKLIFIAHRIGNPTTGGEFYNDALLIAAENAGLVIERWEGQKYGVLIKFIAVINIIYLFKTMTIQKRVLLLLDTDFHARYILALLWAKYVKRAKIIGMLHHYNYQTKKNLFQKKIHFIIEKFVSHQFEFLITNSHFSLQNFESLTSKTIPNFIAEPFVARTNSHGISKVIFNKSCLHLVQVGTIEYRKNNLNILMALNKLVIPFRMDFVGHCFAQDYYKQLKKYINETGMAEKVIFHGKVDTNQLDALYRDSTVFVLVSRFEGYGMVYAEAMTYGLPIIGTTRGAVPELVEHGVNGYLCDPDDPKQIAASIEKMFDKKSWEMFSKNNIRRSLTFPQKEEFIKNCTEMFKYSHGKNNLY